MYYNPITKETKGLYALKELLNASIPDNAKVVGDWHKVGGGQYPEEKEGFRIVQDKIVEQNGKYIYSYIYEQIPEEELAEEKMREKKNARAAIVSSLTVEYNGHTFEADEKSLQRMTTALLAMPDQEELDYDGDPYIEWLDIENNPCKLLKKDLQEVLRIGQGKFSNEWIKPHEV